MATNRSFCRQVLDCGDGVREVTALAPATLKIATLVAQATSTQSGDSEDSVAAVQDARAPTRFALGSWSRCAIIESWKLPMNLVGDEVTSLTFLSTSKEDQRLVTWSPTGLFLISMHGKNAIQTPHSTLSFPNSSP